MTGPELGLLRLVAQRIAGPRWGTAAGAVRWLTAVQGQDYRGAVTSVALRTDATFAGTDRAAAVVAALDAGEVVRSWPMRGTLHLVAAPDLPWLLDLTARVTVTRQARRRAELGLDDALIDRARDLAVDALSGGRRLTRAELLARWDGAGVPTTGQRGYHLISHLAQTGTLCFGPVRDGEQQLVLIEEWIPAPRVLDRDEALGELCLRYVRSHGPATVQDLAGWTKLPAADVRTGVALAAPHLGRLDVDGTTYWLDPRTPELLDAHRADARGLVLLPGFDEFVLGHTDRSAVLAPEFTGRICPGGNGVFQPTVVLDGRIIGTWKRSWTPRRGDHGTGPATPFTSFPPEVEAAVRERFAALP